jgi:hypothetical protein
MQILKYFTIKTAQAVQITSPLKPGLDSFEGVAKGIADILTALGIPLAVIFFVWAGFLFVTARGNPQQITKAKSAFWWTVVGTVVLIGAIAIATAVANFAKAL